MLTTITCVSKSIFRLKGPFFVRGK